MLFQSVYFIIVCWESVCCIIVLLCILQYLSVHVFSICAIFLVWSMSCIIRLLLQYVYLINICLEGVCCIIVLLHILLYLSVHVFNVCVIFCVWSMSCIISMLFQSVCFIIVCCESVCCIIVLLLTLLFELQTVPSKYCLYWICIFKGYGLSFYLLTL